MFLRQAGGLDGGHEGRLGAGREVCSTSLCCGRSTWDPLGLFQQVTSTTSLFQQQSRLASKGQVNGVCTGWL